MTSFDAGKLYMLGCDANGELAVNDEEFSYAKGLCLAGDALLVGAEAHIYRMENILRRNQLFDGIYSHCYLSRTEHFTGALDCHDVGTTSDGQILFVSARYSCLATVSDVHSFKMLWKPSFISSIVAEDRCHLNGLAMRNGQPAYVTAFARSDKIDGWRNSLKDGGVVIDIATGEIVCAGLSMPHSPRIYEDKLWLLNSGTGELGCVDTSIAGKLAFKPLTFCPGFTRGLSFCGHYALVGVSRPRNEKFDGLDLDSRIEAAGSEAKTGVNVVDIRSGDCVEWFFINDEAREIYDVVALPGVRRPACVASSREEALGLITME